MEFIGGMNMITTGEHKVYNSSCTIVGGEAIVHVYGNSKIIACGSSKVYVYGNSKITASGNAVIYTNGLAEVKLNDNAFMCSIPSKMRYYDLMDL